MNKNQKPLVSKLEFLTFLIISHNFSNFGLVSAHVNIFLKLKRFCLFATIFYKIEGMIDEIDKVGRSLKF